MAAVKKPSLVAIVGETASGKSALALQLAERYNGELIAADSRTVYKGMDIGTAKPSAAEQKHVPCHLLDVITPDQTFTAADFQRLANQAIKDIQSRGKLPIIVGGTGLYVDAVLYNFTFKPAKTAQPLRPGAVIIGLQIPREELKQRVTERVEQMFVQGLEHEVQNVANTYGWHSPGLSAIGYKEFQPYFAGQQSLEKTKQLIITHTLQYAKRQRTWFKRNPDIQWCSSFEQASATIGG